MTDVLALAIHFAGAAIFETLGRRGQADPYSASAEVARLAAELALADNAPRGLDSWGQAAAARVLIDEVVDRQRAEPFSALVTRLDLNRVERDLLALLFGWAVEPRVGVLFGHVHDSLQKTRPTVGAVAEVLRDPVGVMVALGPTSVLRMSGIIEIDRPGPDGTLSIDPRVVHFLATGEIAPLTVPAGRLSRQVAHDRDPSVTDQAANLTGVDVVAVRGATGAGRHRFAATLAAEERRSMLRLRIDRADHDTLRSIVTAAVRDARILDARLVVSGAIDEAVARALAEANEVPLVVILDPAQRTPQSLLERPIANVSLSVPSIAERTALWADALGCSSTNPEVAAVATRYAFTPGLIRRAARQCSTLGLEEAARMQLSHELDGLARCGGTNCGWDRLVVPPVTLESLRALCAQARQLGRVGEDWGFARHHSLGRGVKGLFYGRPGTGKTLAAEVVATDLDLPLYRIDLSRIVSKWIGETEQNLSRLFDEAAKSQAILFFDEADSLFAKRTAIQTSTDRYANMEVNHLLQRVDAHEGIVILATNLKANLDDGFSRRLHFVIEFPEPDRAAREQIWRLSIPPEAPLSDDVDLALLARRFDIPGGAIKNAVVGAAYLAASDGGAIEQRHLAAALRREFSKLDRLYQRAELDALAPPVIGLVS